MSRSTPTELQFDVRLIKRRGWIAAEKLETELSKLPDVSGKIAESGDPPDVPTPESEPSGAATSAPEVSGADA